MEKSSCPIATIDKGKDAGTQEQDEKPMLKIQRQNNIFDAVFSSD